MRAALRAGRQVEVFHRVRGPVWLEPTKIVEVLEQVRSYDNSLRQLQHFLRKLFNASFIDPPPPPPPPPPRARRGRAAR